ncbi:MAG: hypothetical protein ACTSO9_08960 [Candidatus Helarchaeota archaeon]
MEQKWELCAIIGSMFIILGVLFLILGYGSHKQEVYKFDVLTLVIFMRVAPPIPSDIFDVYYYSLSYIYLDLYLTFYVILLETIQEFIAPFLLSYALPLTAVISLTVGGIFIVLTIILVKKQYFNAPREKMKV